METKNPTDRQTISHNSLMSQKELDMLFGTDYEFLKQNGDLDLFFVDPELNFDGLKHVLVGDERGGFHCEAASSILGFDHPSHRERTEVDRVSMSNVPSKRKREFRVKPFEPWNAHVAVHGKKKMVVRKNKDGPDKVYEASNVMFPSEYDPTAVVRAVSIAYKNRDEDMDQFTPSPERDLLVNRSASAPMLDGDSEMGITLVLDAKTKKIVSAYPHYERGGYMNLEPEDVLSHLFSANVNVDNPK